MELRKKWVLKSHRKALVECFSSLVHKRELLVLKMGWVSFN